MVRMVRMTLRMAMMKEQVERWELQRESVMDQTTPVEDQIVKKRNIKHDINIRTYNKMLFIITSIFCTGKC